MEWLGMYGFNNTYGLAVRKEIAEKYNLKAYSDLKAVASQLVFGAEYDFYEREDGYDALCNSYGLSFKETRDMDIGLKYQAINQKEIDVMVVFTTDGQLSASDITVLTVSYTHLNIVLKNTQNKSWFIYAVLSAVFASLTSILGKIGIEGVESNLGTAIRTSVVLIMAWLIVIATKKQSKVYSISKRELLFISLSGVATGGAWLCYYKALQDGLASVVVPIDKLSILVTIVFSYIVFKEKISKKSGFGLVLILLGTLLMVIPTL